MYYTLVIKKNKEGFTSTEEENGQIGITSESTIILGETITEGCNQYEPCRNYQLNENITVSDIANYYLNGNKCRLNPIADRFSKKHIKLFLREMLDQK